MDLNNLSVIDIVKGIKSRRFSCVDITKHYLSNIENYYKKN